MIELFEARMARNSKLLENSTFVEIMKENWLQVRHLGTQRMWFAIAYALILTATLAYMVHRGISSLAADQVIVLLLPLLVISAVWLGITLKLNAEASNYVRAICTAFTEGKIMLGEKDDWRSYMCLPLSPTGGILAWFTTGNLLVLFYSAVGLASLGVILNAAI